MEQDLEKEYIVEDIIRDDDDITSLYLNQSGEGDERTPLRRRRASKLGGTGPQHCPHCLTRIDTRKETP